MTVSAQVVTQSVRDRTSTSSSRGCRRGSPAMSLPMGETRAGLPIGVHVSGRVGEEGRLLELAYEVEATKPWRRIHDAASLVSVRS